MRLRCPCCNKTYSRFLYNCPACNGNLELELRIPRLRWSSLRKQPFSHWRYAPLLPPMKKRVSMHEGGTPLVPSQHHGKLWFKLEGLNPTGSFKDRGSTVEVSYAVTHGAQRLIVASTGNMGASISAYASRAGLKSEVVVPKTIAKEKIQQIINHGARIIKVSGSYDDAVKIAEAHYKRGHDWLVGDYVLRGEGEKTTAFELADQLAPDVIVFPVGNGTMISATYKAYQEMRKAGLVKRMPQLVAVQARGASTVARAFLTKRHLRPVKPKTIASGIAVGDPRDGWRAVYAIKESRGTAVEVSDNEILAARRHLAKTEGIDCEPASAATYAGYRKLLSRFKTKRVVLVLTGHGLKDMRNC